MNTKNISVVSVLILLTLSVLIFLFLFLGQLENQIEAFKYSSVLLLIALAISFAYDLTSMLRETKLRDVAITEVGERMENLEKRFTNLSNELNQYQKGITILTSRSETMIRLVNDEIGKLEEFVSHFEAKVEEQRKLEKNQKKPKVLTEKEILQQAMQNFIESRKDEIKLIEKAIEGGKVI